MATNDVIDEEIVEAPPSLRDTLNDAIEEHDPDHTLIGSDQGLAPIAEVQPTQASTEQPTPQAAPPNPAAPSANQPAATPPVSTELKAPAQWKPAVREKWNTLPREVQEEVLRRESDSMRLIGSVGPKIRMADHVTTQIEPFRELLASNGVHEADFISDVFQSVRDLKEGSPQQKAEVVANIVQSYGIDIRHLDQILTQRIHQGPEVMEARRATARANSVINGQNNAVAHETAVKAESTISAFAADPKHEFIDDVRNQMADLIELGQAKTLEDAYTSAIWANPNTRKILLEREAQGRAKVKNDRANVARRASSSVRGAPAAGRAAPVGNTDGMTLRDTLTQAFDEASSL